MYSDIFCKVYNEFGWNYYPEAFGQQLLQWLQAKKISPESALDLGCGTGILCRILHAQGMEVWGMDLSTGMIDIARKGNPHIHYEAADMITYRPERQFDLVTCTGDAFNHIGCPDDLRTIFRNIYGYLAPDGWLVFDILNEHEVSDSEPFHMDFDERTRMEFQMIRPGENRVDLCIRVWEDGIFRFAETIRETVHDPAVIRAMLAEIGFRNINCSDRLLPEQNRSTTWYITAQK